MLSRISFALLCAALIACVTLSCTHEPKTTTPLADGGYPPEIAKIIITRCAISGCHNQASYEAADGLLLDTWDHMFNGDNTGAVVVPYWPQYSPLLYFVNPDSSLGPILRPIMPVAGYAPQLTKDEYATMKSWIAAGAPDKNGKIAFSDNTATRQKIYALTNDNGIDLMAVIDAERKVIMRFIKVGGDDASPESGHDVVSSADGNSLYESFSTGTVLQKVDMLNDVNAGTLPLGDFGWALLCLKPDDSKLMISNWTSNAPVLSIKTAPLSVDIVNSYSALQYPHGIAANATFDTFFVSASNGNCIYKCVDPINIPHPELISLNGHTPTDAPADHSENLGPHAIWMAPDFSKYFVTCQNSNEVRVMDAHADTLMAVIPVGAYPQELKAPASSLTPYLFVTCRQDSTASTPRGNIGSVCVINYNTMKIVKTIYGDFRQPHGIAIDNQNGLVYILSLNIDGPPQHHAVKNFRDGWYSIIDAKTLEPYNTKRYELLANPYEATARFE